MKALNLAVSGKVIEHVVPSFKKLDAFLGEWNLGIKDKRDLFLTVANILKDSKRLVFLHIYVCMHVMRLIYNQFLSRVYFLSDSGISAYQQKSLLTTLSSILKLFLVMMHWLWLKLRKKLSGLLLILLSRLRCFR